MPARPRGMTFGKGNLRATITGILADPAATADMTKAIEQALRPEVARIARVMKGATPISEGPARPGGGNPPPGSLQKAVDVYGAVAREGTSYVLMARADAAVRKPTKGDSKRSATREAAHLANEAKRQARAAARGKKFRPRKLSAKKGGRRYGPVPYGIFVDNETGFLTDTMTEEYPAIVTAIHGAILSHVDRLNKGSGETPRAS